MHERKHERELLLVAVGVLTVLATEIERQPRRQSGDIGVADVTSQSLDVADDLRSAPAAELGKLTGDVAHLPLHFDGLALAVETEDLCRATRRVDQAHEKLDRRRLARAVRAEVAKDLPRVHAEVEVEDSPAEAVVLGQAARLDRGGIPFVRSGLPQSRLIMCA